VIDSAGGLLYAEAGAHRVVRYDIAAKTSTVIAGTGTAGFSGDGGAATSALLNSPGDLALDSQGNLFIADRGNRRVRRVSPDGTIQTIAGSGRSFSYADFSGEPATAIGFDRIDGMTVDADGNLYLSESLRVSIVRADGKIYILTGFRAEDDDGARSFIDGPLNGCDGLFVDRSGRLYISLREEGRVVLAAPSEEETK
jgi:sugar lactone lactonase YvrE